MHNASLNSLRRKLPFPFGVSPFYEAIGFLKPLLLMRPQARVFHLHIKPRRRISHLWTPTQSLTPTGCSGPGLPFCEVVGFSKPLLIAKLQAMVFRLKVKPRTGFPVFECLPHHSHLRDFQVRVYPSCTPSLLFTPTVFTAVTILRILRFPLPCRRSDASDATRVNFTLSPF